MQNRPIVVRLRPYTSTRTWAELKTLTKQGVIDAFIADNDPLSAEEVIQLNKWWRYAINFLILEWVRQEKLDIISGYMRQSRIDAADAEKLKVTEWLKNTKGLSQDTADTLYSDCLTILEAE